MNHIKDRQLVRSQWRTGPLATWLEPFAQWLQTKGYAFTTIRRKILLVSGFSLWLKHEEITLTNLSSSHRHQYLQHRWQRLSPNKNDRYALQQFTDFLQQKGALPIQKSNISPATDVELCIQVYENHLRQMRGLAKATIKNYVRFVRCFLQHRFGSGKVSLSHLCAADVVGYVQQATPDLHPKSAKLMSSALRSFLRYACSLGEVNMELADTVPSVASWSLLNIPRGISVDAAEKLLASIDRTCATGRRDYAVIIMLVRLGLRSREIQALELDDIDWVNATMKLQTKSGRDRTLPLSKEVGEAITDYLSDGRPQCATRRVFVQSRAPIRECLSLGGLSSIVRRSIKRAGMPAPSFGTHQFRHGLATEMLRQQSSLAEIGDILGHVHPDTTRIYAKVDLEALRPLALPWPGGVQ